MKRFFIALLLSTQLFATPEPLIVGTTTGYAPYVSLGIDGNYEGFDMDFAQELATKLGRTLVIKDCGSMPSLLMALQLGKVDILIWAISITDERMKKMSMVYYQGEKVTQMPLLFWKEVDPKIKSIDDLAKGYPVSVEAGSFQESVLRGYPEVKLKQVEKVTDGVMEIRFGKSGALMVDPSLVAKLKEQYPEIRLVYLDLKPENYSFGNGICIRKNDSALREEVQKATDLLIQEGKIRALEKKWNLGGA